MFAVGTDIDARDARLRGCPHDGVHAHGSKRKCSDQMKASGCSGSVHMMTQPVWRPSDDSQQPVLALCMCLQFSILTGMDCRGCEDGSVWHVLSIVELGSWDYRHAPRYGLAWLRCASNSGNGLLCRSRGSFAKILQKNVKNKLVSFQMLFFLTQKFDKQNSYSSCYRNSYHFSTGIWRICIS